MINSFVETNLKTKFGEFIIRVYNEDLGKETIVLRTLNLNKKIPINIRIHSECFTGDLFKSLHCDCGDQLEKSLHFIGKNGGVLIYLRQEGRGIGLFEKMKTYQLQSRGYDTFEANIKLGHAPDLRKYEKVKMILDDLQINKIRLLTNNPSKVSEVAKLGIEVKERIPLIIRSNKSNKYYLETKRDKFQHMFNEKINNYFYQFHADSPDQIKQVALFLKDKKTDPLLKIGVGVSANNSTLSNKEDITRIESIFKKSNSLKDFIPILHFTFRNSTDILSDLKAIKKQRPFVFRIQLNDLPFIDINFMRIAHSLFKIDLPLSDEDFDSIHNEQLKDLFKKNNTYILLDNSKGRGIKESRSSLKKKIDVLLKYGLNNIVLCGGFGPDELDNYFDIKTYYMINFSIDAETKLKTNGKIDMKKIKNYLIQLLFSSNKNNENFEERINQARKFLEKNKCNNWEKAVISDIEFLNSKILNEIFLYRKHVYFHVKK